MNKHPRFDTNSAKSADLRSDIDHTRQRLDETIDAIAARLRGRHLMDEALHFIRSKSGDGEMRQKASDIRSKISDSTGSVVHAVADTVKAHPLPALLIGAGLAWLVYEKQRPEGARMSRRDYPEYDPDYDARREAGFSAAAMEESQSAGVQTSLPTNYSGSVEGESKLEHLKETASEKAGEIKERVQRGAARLGERTRERTQEWRERSGEMTGRLQERAGMAYDRTRERVSTAVEEHPLESAITCLAAGLVVGMLLPTPRPVDEAVAPTADRLRRRVRDTARDAIERGKHVAQAAATAAREEARAQGLTPEARKETSASAPPAKSSSGQLPSPEGSSGASSPDDAASPGF